MTDTANSRTSTANFGLTEAEKASICAALPRSSNGKTTDSDSETAGLNPPELRNLNSICSPPDSVGNLSDCELSAVTTENILLELARVKLVFQQRAICAAMGVNYE